VNAGCRTLEALHAQALTARNNELDA